MTNSTQPKTWVRVVNGFAALAFTLFLLINYWQLVRLFDLVRADLQYQGVWIEGHAKRITAVTPGGLADRAGLKAGDVLEFDPGRASDWVLAGYRNAPEGFSATLPVRHVDGTRALVSLAPERVTYLPTLNDRVALLARLGGLSIAVLVGVLMVWARPSLMTWSLFLSSFAAAPVQPWFVYRMAYVAGQGEGPLSFAPMFTLPLVVALVPFALCFPRDTLSDWNRRQRVLGLLVGGAAIVFYVYRIGSYRMVPFEPEAAALATRVIWFVMAILVTLFAIGALSRTYRRSGELQRAQLRWALFGMTGTLAVNGFVLVLFLLPRNLGESLSWGSLTPVHWTVALGQGVIFPVSIGYAVLRQRVVDVQFAISRTVVYGIVSTIVLVFLVVLHWLLGRVLEHSGLAFGIEGLAAIGLGLMLHRASHATNQLVDRVLFRKHHQAEERLRRVTAALPFANDELAIAEALVTEPVRNLNLASAALFYRQSPEGPLNRVLAQGWSESHTPSLEADSLLVRYLQVEHAPLKLDDSQLLPAGVPEGAAHPVLAIPIVNQHVLAAVVLYGAHVNHTLLDPDEIELLHQLAKAAAVSHQQVKIAMLVKENSTLQQENVLERARNAQLSSIVQSRLAGASEAGS